MRFAGNVIWFVLGGGLIAIVWLIGAVVFAISILGLPLTRAAVEMAKLSAWPFGREVVHVRELDGSGVTAVTAVTGTIGFIANVVWALTFGLVLFAFYLVAGVLNCLTLIGIPLGLQAFKLAGISLWPVGRRVVTVELAQVAREHAAHERFAQYRGEPKLQSPRVQPPPVAPALPAPPKRGRAPGQSKATPPQLESDRGWFVEVVGEASYQVALAEAAEGAAHEYDGRPLVTATLEPEDDNPHDPNAVRVDVKRGTVGYLPRASAKEYRGSIGARRAICTGLIFGGDGDDEDGEPKLFGIWLNAAWPPRYK